MKPLNIISQFMVPGEGGYATVHRAEEFVPGETVEALVARVQKSCGNDVEIVIRIPREILK